MLLPANLAINPWIARWDWSLERASVKLEVCMVAQGWQQWRVGRLADQVIHQKATSDSKHARTSSHLDGERTGGNRNRRLRYSFINQTTNRAISDESAASPHRWR